MKLSEAIRIGAQKRSQCFGSMFVYPNDISNKTDEVQSSVIGAALEGAGVLNPELVPTFPSTIPTRIFEGLEDGDDHEYLCPNVQGRKCHQSFQIMEMIRHLNDKHQWTREAIADWLEGIGY